jgi:hypothetical protein
MRSLNSPRRKVQLPHIIQWTKRAKKLATTYQLVGLVTAKLRDLPKPAWCEPSGNALSLPMEPKRAEA